MRTPCILPQNSNEAHTMASRGIKSFIQEGRKAACLESEKEKLSAGKCVLCMSTAAASRATDLDFEMWKFTVFTPTAHLKEAHRWPGGGKWAA